MHKKMGHTITFIFDIFCIWGLWLGYNSFKHTLLELANQPDSISLGSRDGFFILGLFLPLIHIFFGFTEHFASSFINKYRKLLNQGVITAIIVLFAAGFISSSWIKSKVENAGYIYCREASGISALARNLVYTKDMEICEDLIDTE